MAKGQDVRQLLQAGNNKQRVTLLQADGTVGGGSLTISAAMLKLSDVRPAAPLLPVGPSEAHLSVKVMSIKGLKEGAEYPFKVRVQVARCQDEVAMRQVSSDSPPKKQVSAKLKASKSATASFGGASKMQVVAESSTAASHPAEQKQLAEALQGIAKQLSQKGQTPQEIAELLDVGPKQVELYLHKLDIDAEAAKALELKQLEFQQVRKPLFEEVVQLLLPCGSVDDHACLELAVVDKREKALATARVTMSQLLDAPKLQIDGPFATDAEGIEVVGSMQLRWLV
jgi:predicted transcriptional regulator